MIAQSVRPKRVAIYCRVSSAGQEDNSSLETQEAACRHYAASEDGRSPGSITKSTLVRSSLTVRS